MINKQGIWFLTLFCLVLVLGIYYITMPNDLMSASKEINVDNSEISIEENDILASIRVERDEKTLNTMESLETILNKEESSAEEKNEAFEELKLLNLEKGKETLLEDKIEENFNIKSVIEINENDIYVSINSSEHDYSLANKIMRKIQEDFESDKNIVVKFQ